MNHSDEFHMAYARNLTRMLAGHFLTVGPEDREQVVCVDRIKDVTVGIDRDGLFAGVTVYDTNGGVWTLYTNGTIADDDDSTVGRHDLTFESLRPQAVL
jgi:hypothetical protein